MTTTTARLVAETGGPQAALRFSGPLAMGEVEALRLALRRKRLSGPVSIDLSEVTRLDTAGAWLVADTLRRLGGSLSQATEPQRELIETVTRALPDDSARPVRKRVTPALEQLGASTVAGLAGVLRLLGFFGQLVASAVVTLFHPRRLRLTALVAHIGQAGIGAAGIVALMSFLIGIVLAYQGAQQLTQFGAEVFVVDLVAVSLLRELAPLLTAILVAGRSASGFTAAIGSMKMQRRDRRNADHRPRSDRASGAAARAGPGDLPAGADVSGRHLSGLLGGALTAWAQLGVSPQVFQTRLLDVDVSHFLIGMVKARSSR